MSKELYIAAHAEEVEYGVVFKIVDRPSRYLKGVMAKARIIECPACHKTYDDPGANTTIRCDCGLSMRFCSTGAAIWRDLPQAAE